jgi:hypothetical protein
MALHELIYVSLSIREMLTADLIDLLHQSRTKNERLNITGLLVYHRREFMQLLEGDKADVLALYDTICRDSRHDHLNKLWDGPLEERNFPRWSMAFCAPAELALREKPGYSDFLKRELVATRTHSTGKKFLLMLRDDFLRKR